MGQGYAILPRYYDRWQSTYGKDFSHIVFPRLQATLARYRRPVTSVVDIGCGTGTLACMLAERGWDAFGIDASSGMIAEANAKAAEAGLTVRFSCQEMAGMYLPVTVDLVTAFFDVLNHLTERQQLARTVERVFQLLRPGGLFVFDTSNERCYHVLWTRTDVIHHPDFFMTLENRYSPDTCLGESLVTVFAREGERYRREEETVRQRYYSRRETVTILRKNGFRVLEHRDFGFPNDPATGKMKTWWVARKPGAGK
jgi:SAM-dependent methyltransferase